MSGKDKINIFHDFVKARKKALNGGKIQQSDEKEILSEAERLEIVNKATIVLCELILDGEKVADQIKENRRLFLRFTNENQKAQKYLMGGFECLIAAREELLLPKAMAILKAFYDMDIIEEEIILDWGKKVSKKYVSKELSEKIHKKVDPFLKWLKEADEESDESEDDELELEFDERAKISSMQQKKEEPKANGKEEPNAEIATTNGGGADEEDLDIDDI